MREISHARLYGILDLGYLVPGSLMRRAEEMIDGGVDVFQLRAKNFSIEEICVWAKDLAPFFREAGRSFIVNDFPEVAALVGADGVHIGQDGGRIDEARAAAASELVPRPIVGRSTHSQAQAEAAEAEGADYIGFGPLFPTATKPGRAAIGTEQIDKTHQAVSLPVFCIGGITLENLPAVLAAGARRVVIVSGILQASDVRTYCREVKAALQEVWH